MPKKYKLETSKIAPWRKSVLIMVKEKNKKLKQEIQPKQTQPILCDPDLISCLETFHKRFVVVNIDKAAKNFVFMCK